MAGCPTYTALVDSNVMYPILLTDVMLRLHKTSICCIRWSEKILDEARIAIVKNRPDIDQAKIDRRFDLMLQAAPDAMIVGYEELVDQVDLWPDQNDKHVLAAAIVGHCDTIVTFNTKHFKDEYLERYGITATHPDQFIADQIDLQPGIILQVFKEMRADRKKNNSVDQLILEFQKCGLSETVEFLDEFKDHI